MTHLAPGELVDAVEGVLGPERRAHLDTCASCRTAVSELAELLTEARSLEVPEPSPLFWEHLSSRIREAIHDEASSPGNRTPAWWQWTVLVPIAVLVVLVTGLGIVLPGVVKPRVTSVGPASSEAVTVTEGTTGDATWRFLTEVMDSVDLDEIEREGLALAPGTADAAVVRLDAAERRALIRLLEAELARPES